MQLTVDFFRALIICMTLCLQSAAASASITPERKAFFGDLHVHTKYSFDAFIFGTRADPDDAYRYVKGRALEHASGMRMQLDRPLDFLAVTDHATYLGMLPEMDNSASSVGQHPLSIALRNANSPAARSLVYDELLPRERGYIDFEDDLLDLDVVRTAWAEIIAAAERHNEPSSFTTFIGYEFTAGGRHGQNLHRNVIFAGSDAPPLPFSRLDGDNNPELLWDWMDTLRAQGIDTLAIPHNSNGSDGWMFELTDRSGNAIDQVYAEKRMRNEPLVEVTQVKGTSETHPLLSPNDEWAGFEIMNYTIGSGVLAQPSGGYAREAYLNGLALSRTLEGNPYRFGLIGSSDTHNAAGSFEEENYWSKSGLLDVEAEQRGSVPDPDSNIYADSVRRFWSASELAGVWAEENTRSALFKAFRRKETFATSGPRIRLRMFAGHELDPSIEQLENSTAQAYALGVPMGGDLGAANTSTSPQFFVWAIQDAAAAPLERVQIVKGWTDGGTVHEQVFDIACADGTKPAGPNFRCTSDSGIDISVCERHGHGGAAELRTFWQDPDFDYQQRAFYYARVLQVPTCRWSTWDAIRAGVPARPDIPARTQERAWSSPIWYWPTLNTM